MTDCVVGVRTGVTDSITQIDLEQFAARLFTTSVHVRAVVR